MVGALHFPFVVFCNFHTEFIPYKYILKWEKIKKALISFHKVDLSWDLDSVRYELNEYQFLFMPQLKSQGNLSSRHAPGY